MVSLLAMASLLSVQEIRTFNDPFDAYSAVLADIPEANIVQEGSPATVPFAYIQTTRARADGRIDQYLKLTLEYVTAPGALEVVNVTNATFEGGEETDFQVIESTEDCLPNRPMCKRREVLSVRFPFVDATGRLLRVQFKNRTMSWRGTVTIPRGLLAANAARAAKLK